MENRLIGRMQIVILVLFLFAPMVFSSVSSVVQLTDPDSFLPASTLLDFDDGVHLQNANTLYLDKGVEFSRDDGQGVAIYNSSAHETSSDPYSLITVGAPDPDYPASIWVTHLNATFTIPVSQVGAYYGNTYTKLTLSAYGQNGALLGEVTVDSNGSRDVDQFIGLSSNELIYSVRFHNNETRFAVAIDDFRFSPVPEPATISLFALGGLALRRKRKG